MCYYFRIRESNFIRRETFTMSSSPTASKFHTFSVIMPCYNSEGYVRSAIESITRQTYPHWELIAVNDGSTDGTLEILTAQAARDSRIKVVSKPNGGYVSAVNFGLEHITGDYFLMMGSDDALSPSLFDELHRDATVQAADCIAFRSVIVRDGEAQGVESITNFSGAVSQFDTTLARFCRDYPKHGEIFSTRDTSKCYRTSLLGDLRYLGRYGFDADGIFSMMLCHNARSFSAIPVDGYFWTLRGDSLSGRKGFFAQDLDRMEIWTAFYRYLLERDTQEITAAELNFLYYFLNITETVWRQASPLFAHLPQVRSAVSAINGMLAKTGFDLSVSRKSKLLLRFPALWKLCARIFR